MFKTFLKAHFKDNKDLVEYVVIVYCLAGVRPISLSFIQVMWGHVASPSFLTVSGSFAFVICIYSLFSGSFLHKLSELSSILIF